MLNELYTFAEPVQVVPFSSLKWGKFTLLHTYQRVNGTIVNGKPARFTNQEIDILNAAIQDMGNRLLSTKVVA